MKSSSYSSHEFCSALFSSVCFGVALIMRSTYRRSALQQQQQQWSSSSSGGPAAAVSSAVWRVSGFSCIGDTHKHKHKAWNEVLNPIISDIDSRRRKSMSGIWVTFPSLHTVQILFFTFLGSLSHFCDQIQDWGLNAEHLPPTGAFASLGVWKITLHKKCVIFCKWNISFCARKLFLWQIICLWQKLLSVTDNYFCDRKVSN